MIISFGMSVKETIGRYLGCNIFKGRVIKKIFEDLIDRSRKKLDSWKENNFLKERRIIFIWLNLEVMSVYIM